MPHLEGNINLTAPQNRCLIRCAQSQCPLPAKKKTQKQRKSSQHCRLPKALGQLPGEEMRFQTHPGGCLVFLLISHGGDRSNKSTGRLPSHHPPLQPRLQGMLATPDVAWRARGRVCSGLETSDPWSRGRGLAPPRSPRTPHPPSPTPTHPYPPSSSDPIRWAPRGSPRPPPPQGAPPTQAQA